MINAIRENYSVEVLFKNCSFHWIDNVRKSLIGGGLKKKVKKANLKSRNGETRYIARAWIVIRTLPFLPPSISKQLIEVMIIACDEMRLSNKKIAWAAILAKIKRDHADEDKFRRINWWDCIKSSSSFVDTTTSKCRTNISHVTYKTNNSFTIKPVTGLSN